MEMKLHVNQGSIDNNERDREIWMGVWFNAK